MALDCGVKDTLFSSLGGYLPSLLVCLGFFNTINDRNLFPREEYYVGGLHSEPGGSGAWTIYSLAKANVNQLWQANYPDNQRQFYKLHIGNSRWSMRKLELQKRTDRSLAR